MKCPRKPNVSPSSRLFLVCVSVLLFLCYFPPKTTFHASLRINSYQQEIPTRFKKDMVSQCNRSIATDTTDDREQAVEGIEGLLQNIGVFGKEVSHDDVECIVSEFKEEETEATIRADKILSKIL